MKPAMKPKMKHSALKINVEFPVEFGAYHVHIWGKPENDLQSEQQEIDLVDAQFNELRAHYADHYQLQLSILNQVHGNRTVDARALDSGIPQADSFYTSDENIALAIKTADCIPVLFFNTLRRFFGAIHSGWRGLELEILRSTLKIAKFESGGEINELQFIVGPHILTENYETTEEVYNRFSHECSEPVAGTTKRNLDLKMILENQFSTLEIKKVQTTWINQNTFKSNHFFSHRSGDKGRNYNVIFFKKNLR
jgi:hypothetical protein